MATADTVLSSRHPAQQWSWQAAAVTGVAVVAAPLCWWWWRRRSTALPDVSVPEALCTLEHGPLEKRVLAARGLIGILQGEVQVLEELLDEARGKHPEFGSGRRCDGRSVLGVVLSDLAGKACSGENVCATDAEAFADLLLQCTCFDKEWGDDDEWNELTQSALDFLRDHESAEELLSAAEHRHAGKDVAVKAQVLKRRLRGEREAAAAVNDEALAPGMLSMNTRVKCAVCLTMSTDMVRCPQCRNVAYCSAEHLREDAERHAAWCFAPA